MASLVAKSQVLQEAIQVMLHDLHLASIIPPPRKFNGAQQIAYTSVILNGRRIGAYRARDLQTSTDSGQCSNHHIRRCNGCSTTGELYWSVDREPVSTIRRH